jgi:hypothetical protein
MSKSSCFDEKKISSAKKMFRDMGYKKINVLINPALRSAAPTGLEYVMNDEVPKDIVRILGEERIAPWWTSEWEKNQFHSYLNWCGETSCQIHVEIYDHDFSGWDTDRLFDISRFKIASAHNRWCDFSPRVLDNFDWDGTLRKFRGVFGQEENARTIEEIYNNPANEELLGITRSYFVSFLAISGDIVEAETKFKTWAQDYELRIPVFTELLRRNAPKDTKDFPVKASEWSLEMHKELVGRLESSNDPRYAQLNGLSASIIGHEDAELRYRDRIYDLLAPSFKKRADWQSRSELCTQDELLSESYEGFYNVWANAKAKHASDPKGSFVSIIDENIVTRSMYTRAEHRRMDFRTARSEDSKLLEFKDDQEDHVTSGAAAEIEYQMDLTEPKFEYRRGEVHREIERLYPTKRRVRNYTRIYNLYFDLVLSRSEIPDIPEMAELADCSPTTIDRFRKDNKEHHWINLD